MSNPFDQGFTPTDSEMLNGVRQALARIAGTGASYRTPDGRMWKSGDEETLMKLERYYQSRVDAATSADSYVKFLSPTG